MYEYIFVGKAEAGHVFDVMANRKVRLPVVVCLGRRELRVCEERMGTALRWNDEYALAKLALFDAFDCREDVESFRDPVRPTEAELIGYMKTLRMLEDDE